MSTPLAPPGAQLAAGAVLLDRYRVVEAIAAGGHSMVYRGHDRRLDRPVCIKVFTRYPADAGISRTAYEHFVQEAFALSRLTHPHTLRIYDFGHLPVDRDADGAGDGTGLPFHVSEYMDGGTLAQLVRERGAQPWADAIPIAAALGLALAEAHGLGIIHRDLKPQNILFAQAAGLRLPKLADFGIAKWHELHDPRADAGARAGDTQQVSGHRMAMYSPSWAAPEQLAGGAIDPASDLYSLALLTVYMLTGRAIFADDDVYEGYRKRKSSDAIAGAALEPLALPPAAVALLQRALAFDGAHRPRDAAGFVAELAAAFDAPPAAAAAAAARLPTEPATPRGPRPAPRRAPWTTEPFAVAGRTARFVATSDGAGDISGLGGAVRLRLSLIPAADGPHHLHVKGLSCFVARTGARPSIAVQVEGDAMLELVAGDRSPIGRVRLARGAPAAGHTLFRFGDETVAIDVDECPDVVLVDFGAGAECAFVHGPRVPADPHARRAAKPG